MGFSAMFVLGRPAEPIRPLLLARRCRMAVSSMFGIYVLERLFDTAATAVLAGSSLLFFGSELTAGGEWAGRIRAAGGALLIGLIVFAALLVYFQMHGADFLQRRLTGWRAAEGWRGFVATQVGEFGDGLQAVRGLSDWWAAVMYSALHWGLIVFIYLLVMRSFGGALEQFTFSGAMLVLAFTMLGSLVQLPGVGGGAQLASFIALTQDFPDRAGAGSGGGRGDLADYVCGVMPGGIAAADSRGAVHGRIAPPGERGSPGRNPRSTREPAERARRRAGPCVRGRGWRAVKCPFCSFADDKVIDSREAKTGDLIRRRRECLKCGRRFTTYERIDEIPYMVIKKDGRRERFDRQKILQGLLKACEKRPVPTARLEAIVDEVERFVHEAPQRERTTTEIGEQLMARLKKLDKVAYVRFASVYLDFKDVKEFMKELKGLLRDRSRK